MYFRSRKLSSRRMLSTRGNASANLSCNVVGEQIVDHTNRVANPFSVSKSFAIASP